MRQVLNSRPLPSSARRYLQVTQPVFRNWVGILLAVVVFGGANAIVSHGGQLLASSYLTLLGTYCVLNFLQCRETHCVITGPGWLEVPLLGFAATIAPASAMNWYGLNAEGIAALAVCAVGFGLEWVVGARTQQHTQR